MISRSRLCALLAASMLMSSLMGMSSMAAIVEGINGGPGVSMETSTEAAPDGSIVTDQAPTDAAGSNTGAQAPQGTGQPQTVHPGTGSSQTVGPGQSDATSGPGYTPGVPDNSFTDAMLLASRGIDNSDLRLTQEAGSVGPDPVLGQVPETHGQLMQTNGMLSDGFTSNMGFFNSPTDGFSGLKLRINVGIGDIFYRVYTDEHGWTKWAMNDMVTPLYGDNAKVTAVQIRAQGYTRNLYDVYYRVQLNDGTVLDWAHDGQTAGTMGTGRYIQSIQMKLWTKGMRFYEPTAQHMVANAYEGVTYDASGLAVYSTASGVPYTGWAYDTLGNKYYFVNNGRVNGWQYIDGYKYFFDQNGVVVRDLEPIMGKTGDYIIKLNKDMKTLTVYTRDGENGYIIPYKVFLTTVGDDTPIGTYKTYVKYRWKFMHDNIYCQFCARFYNGFLMHSLIYQDSPDSYHFEPGSYNEHGKRRSDGCVRLTAGDAAWLYNNCPTGTSITIYNDEWIMGPLDRPAIEWAIPMTQNYDPTDPAITGQSL